VSETDLLIFDLALIPHKVSLSFSLFLSLSLSLSFSLSLSLSLSLCRGQVYYTV